MKKYLYKIETHEYNHNQEMTTARHKVLQYLHKSGAASAREIARALKMSAATVRHHLRVLSSDGRLEQKSVRSRDMRGRPEKVYSLPRSAMGDNLPALADALLLESGSALRIDNLARRLAGEASYAGQPLAKRLNLAVEALNKMNYHAHWEAGSQGPRILFRHCPYAAILEKHPELCQMDKLLLKDMLGQPTSQVFRTGKDESTVCVFVVGR